MPYRLLALDVDGTLLNSKDQLTDRTIEVLAEVQSAGIQVVLATGRRYRTVLPFVEKLKLNVPIITCSGALIKHPGEDHRTYHAATFTEEQLRAWLEVADVLTHEAILHGDTFDQGFDFYYRGDRAMTDPVSEYLHRNHTQGSIWEDWTTTLPSNIFGGFLMGSETQMLKAEQHLHEALPEQLQLHVLRSPMYKGWMCEVARFGITKWSGIRSLADKWGIKDEEICAVGDDVNDLPMIAAAGLGVAMGNAVDCVKEIADRIAPPHDEDGLQEVAAWVLST
ncbi:Pyridoxal phosphate phosphatase YbhA [Planctomycetales bacterium 10988]|nr:Pyridoxal phosphate phosphatase YbhA [Planctomycetales bacterium 10988]